MSTFRSIRRALLVPAVALAALSGGSAAARADAPPLGFTPSAPSVVRVVPAGGFATMPTRGVTDLHCYSARTGRAFRQTDDRAGYAYVTRTGRSVAGWDRATHSFYSFGPAVVCAVWQD